MKTRGGHIFLKEAKKNKKDEFYTQLIDIERELKFYKEHFKNKIVFCNCDDPRKSNFFNYFVLNFNSLKLKKVVCACFNLSNDDLFSRRENGFYYEYTGKESTNPTEKDFKYFNGNGDFRNKESIDLLLQSDIVVTNPPFSLFREYISQLSKYEKKFIIISNINAITYKEVFYLIKHNKAWLGINFGRGISGFIVPDSYELYGQEVKINEFGEKIISPNNCMWLTNLENKTRSEYLNLTKKYYGNEDIYKYYDNYNAININKTSDIPFDYKGTMGVPITFLHKFNPNQFEIIKFRKGDDEKDLRIDGKPTYFRVLIKSTSF